jgi:hypothetical protein
MSSLRTFRPAFGNFVKEYQRAPAVAQDVGRMLAKFDRTQIFHARGLGVPVLRQSHRAFAVGAEDQLM